MRWRVPAAAAAWVVAIALPAAAGPPADVPPTVSFASSQVSLAEGPTAPCSDAIDAGELRTPLVVDDPDGSPEGSLPLAVAHTEGGDAEVGVDYEPLPPTFDPAELVRVSAGDGAVPSGSTVTLTITLEPGDGYVVGEPSTLTVTIIHADRRCDAPTFAAVSTNSAQTIAVGGVPAPLQLVDPVNGTAFAALIGGTLPPGVGLGRDGSFTGAARSAGTYAATVGSCRAAFVVGPGICSSQLLTVTVLGTSLAERPPPCAVGAIDVGRVDVAGFDGSGGALALLAGVEGGRTAAHLYRTASGSLEALDGALATAPSPADSSATIAISADGRAVVFDLPGVEVDQRYFTDVATHDVATGRQRVAFRVEGVVSDLVLSPDGSRAYVLVSASDPLGGLVAADLRTGAVQRLAGGILSELVDVSPDGAWLLGTHLGQPVLVDAGSGEHVALPVDPGSSEGAIGFGTSSSQVLTLRSADGGRSLQRRNLATGATTTVPTADGLLEVVASGAGRALAHAAGGDPLGLNGDGGAEVFLQPPVGPTIQVTETSGAGRPDLLAVSDDGRLVLFAVQGTLDGAGRGTTAESGQATAYLARCGGTALARTG